MNTAHKISNDRDVPKAPSGMTIGRVARAAGVNVETVRYYQRRGLLSRPERPTGGYRRYPTETLTRLRFIRRTQVLGFSLREIAELLGLETQEKPEVRRVAERRLSELRMRLHDLHAIEAALERLVANPHRAADEMSAIVSELTPETPIKRAVRSWGER